VAHTSGGQITWKNPKAQSKPAPAAAIFALRTRTAGHRSHLGGNVSAQLSTQPTATARSQLLAACGRSARFKPRLDLKASTSGGRVNQIFPGTLNKEKQADGQIKRRGTALALETSGVRQHSQQMTAG